MRGLDPRIHAEMGRIASASISASKPDGTMDCRVKPGNDEWVLIQLDRNSL
jgi:hypothetical protein